MAAARKVVRYVSLPYQYIFRHIAIKFLGPARTAILVSGPVNDSSCSCLSGLAGESCFKQSLQNSFYNFIFLLCMHGLTESNVTN
jgi:hypothetical protein